MLIVSKRYHQLHKESRCNIDWSWYVYYRLLAMKRFWNRQGIINC